MSERSYCAFISYRHADPDQKIAVRLHRLIERYALPGALRRQLGVRRLGKVFRDQDELPLSADLGKDIEAALDNSAWLICICSPRYLQSKWCMREIDYFLQNHPRDRVLTLLVDGEPRDSFPPSLQFVTDDAGNRIEKEPLAGDVRGDTARESLRKLKREKYRLLAPMLGVAYDDLYQREHRRTVRNGLLFSGTAIAILGAFLAYALVQNARIDEQRLIAARNACDLLVEKSLSRTAEHRRQEARALALEARAVSDRLDGYGTDAVTDALAATCYTGDFSIDAALELPGAYAELFAFSPDGEKIAAVVSSSAVFCFRADTGEALWDAMPAGLQLTSLAWSPDGRFLAVTSTTKHQVYCLDGETGATLRALDVSWPSGAVFAGEDIMVCFEEGVLRWDPASDGDSVPYAAKAENGSQSACCQTSGNGRFVMWINQITPEVLVADTREQMAARYAPESQQMIGGCGLSEDGMTLFVRQWDHITAYDLEHDEIRWQSVLDAPYGGASMTPDKAVWAENRIFDCGHIYDSRTGECLAVLEESTAEVSADGQYFICPTGVYRVSDGSLYAAAPGEIRAADPTGQYLLIQRDATTKDTMPGKGSYQRLAQYAGSLFDVPDWTNPGEDIALSDPVDWGSAENSAASRLLVSPDGRYCVLINAANHVKVFDTTRGSEPVYRFYGHPSNGTVSVGDASFSADGRWLGVAGSMGTAAVYDLETGKVVRFWRDLYGAVSLEGIRFNRDGSLVMVAGYQNRVFEIYSVSNGLSLYLIHPEKEVADWGFDTQTGDGMIVYQDGSALAADLFATPEELYAFAGSAPEN